MNLEYLRHGKALCGKVFRRFVETFNFHNDFVSNLKGDADLPVVGGKLHLDRTDERHPVIRCQGCGNGGGNATGSPVPWDCKIENERMMIYSPYVVIDGEEVVADGMTKGEWNVVGYGLEGNEYYLAVSWSDGKFYLYILEDNPGITFNQYSAKIASVVSSDDPGQLIKGVPILSSLPFGDGHSIGNGSTRRQGEAQLLDFADGAAEPTNVAAELSKTAQQTEYQGEILVRKRNESGEKVLCYMPFGKGIGGGEGTGGIDGDRTFITDIRYSSGYIQVKTRTIKFEKGVAKIETDESEWTNTIETTPLSEEYS